MGLAVESQYRRSRIPGLNNTNTTNNNTISSSSASRDSIIPATPSPNSTSPCSHLPSPTLTHPNNNNNNNDNSNSNKGAAAATTYQIISPHQSPVTVQSALLWRDPCITGTLADNFRGVGDYNVDYPEQTQIAQAQAQAQAQQGYSLANHHHQQHHLGHINHINHHIPQLSQPHQQQQQQQQRQHHHRHSHSIQHPGPSPGSIHETSQDQQQQQQHRAGAGAAGGLAQTQQQMPQHHSSQILMDPVQIAHQRLEPAHYAPVPPLYHITTTGPPGSGVSEQQQQQQQIRAGVKRQRTDDLEMPSIHEMTTSHIQQQHQQSEMGSMNTLGGSYGHRMTDSEIPNKIPRRDDPTLQQQQQSQSQQPSLSTTTSLGGGGAPSVVGQQGMPEPAQRPKGPKLKFTPEDDQLLIDLKEQKNLTWKQIADFFPGRSSGTLQVRYCTKLKAKTKQWSDEMDQKLQNVLDDYENEKWRIVATKLGTGFTPVACRERAEALWGVGVVAGVGGVGLDVATEGGAESGGEGQDAPADFDDTGSLASTCESTSSPRQVQQVVGQVRGDIHHLHHHHHQPQHLQQQQHPHHPHHHIMKEESLVTYTQ